MMTENIRFVFVPNASAFVVTVCKQTEFMSDLFCFYEMSHINIDNIGFCFCAFLTQRLEKTLLHITQHHELFAKHVVVLLILVLFQF